MSLFNYTMSTHNHKPFKAGADSIISELAVENAHIAGEDWTTDPNTPTANLTTLDEEMPELDLSDDNNNDVPIAYATSVPIPEPMNYWLPNSYAKAMIHPNIWQGRPHRQETGHHEGAQSLEGH